MSKNDYGYESWDQLNIGENVTDEGKIEEMYEKGYLFVRTAHGDMNQTRSVRVDLNKFELSSENRRVLRKADEFGLHIEQLPLAPEEYHWMHGKLIKKFYDTKFGPGTFSANKAKELLTSNKSNFNRLFNYSQEMSDKTLRCFGCCISYEAGNILHYSYPSYDLDDAPKGMGMIMMAMALDWAKRSGKKYVYLGSATRPTDVYKLQFKGLQWFDGKSWQNDQAELKRILKDV